MNKNRVILIVLDSVGIGALPDAAAYGDEGTNTLSHIYETSPTLRLPHLEAMGLGNINPKDSIPPTPHPTAAYGKAAEVSAGKDTTTGHWEIAGIQLQKPFAVFPDGFPDEIIQKFEQESGHKVFFNKPASGTEVIQHYGTRHMQTKEIILYTSADSVFQLAAHEDVVELEELYRICRIARDLLDAYNVSRVIARPFTGDEKTGYTRTQNRRDFSMLPPENTLLDYCTNANIPVFAVGKIEDIFAMQGITRSIHSKNNQEGIEATLTAMQQQQEGLIFTNLVDFDSLYGHRNDPAGYAKALQQFDKALPRLLDALQENDLLIITADHGCDPTDISTDHSREYIPILAFGSHVCCCDIGTRQTFCDIAKTIDEYLCLNKIKNGTSFLESLYQE